MAMMTTKLTVDDRWVVQGLEQAREKLDLAEGELVLDFSSVTRLDPSAVNALRQFADLADTRNVKLILRAVNVDIYKVLKLVKLTPRFSFAN